jgi:predicted dinucleotide-utilizing enzyme
MMSKAVLMTRVAAIVYTLAEASGATESMLYISCDMNMDGWQIIHDILVSANLVSIKGHNVTLTENGKATAVKINSAIRKRSPA